MIPLLFLRLENENNNNLDDQLGLLILSCQCCRETTKGITYHFVTFAFSHIICI